MNERDLLPLVADDPVIAAALQAMGIEPMQGMVSRADHRRIAQWMVDHPQEVNRIGYLNRLNPSPPQATAGGPHLFHF